MLDRSIFYPFGLEAHYGAATVLFAAGTMV